MRRVFIVLLVVLLHTPAFGQQDRISASEKGSFFLIPKIELRWNVNGLLTQDTFIHLANDFPSDVTVYLYFVNGDSPTEVDPGWNFFDLTILLTANQPLAWSTANGSSFAFPMTILDPGVPPGRPDPEGTTDRVLRGYAVGWAVNHSGQLRQIRHNHLMARAVVVNYEDGSAYGYNAYHAQAIVGENGEIIGTEGVLDFGNVYAPAPDHLVFNFGAAHSNAYPVWASGVLVNGDVTLVPFAADFRQESNGPVSTRATFEVWNENEAKLAAPAPCVTCWHEQILSGYADPNPFEVATLQTNTGRARVRGKEGGGCPDAVSTALLGVVRRNIRFLSTEELADASVEMVGVGAREAQILYDPIPDPEGAAVGQPSPGTVVHADPPEAAGTVTRRADTTEPGSVVMIPNVEVRWTNGGFLIQDTYVHLSNNSSDDVRVHLYLVNGDHPLDAAGGEREHRGHNVLVHEFVLTGNQPRYWSSALGDDAIRKLTDIDPGATFGRPANDGTGDRILRAMIVAVAVNDDGAPIAWNHLYADAMVINELRTTAWACNAHHFAANPDFFGDGDVTGIDALSFDGVRYAQGFDQLATTFPALGSFMYTGGGMFALSEFTTRFGVVDRELVGDLSASEILTRLHRTVWNENETQFSGAFLCIDDFDSTPVDLYPLPNHHQIAVLATDSGKERCDGIASALCEDTQDAPLIGVMETTLNLEGNPTATAGHAYIGMGTENATILRACMNPTRCQLPDQGPHGGFVLLGSDVATNSRVADNFTPIDSGSVTSVCWWGSYLDPGPPFFDCGPGDGDIFRITYYRDDGGQPGMVLAGPIAVAAPRVETGNQIGTTREYRYSAVHTPVPVSAGTCYWIEIRNSSPQTCTWLWETAPGDGLAYRDTDGDGYDAGDAAGYDMAFCLDVGLGNTEECGASCFGDLDGDGSVGFTDLVALLASWGPCPGCPADLNGDGNVGFTDLVALLAAWGPCA